MDLNPFAMGYGAQQAPTSASAQTPSLGKTQASNSDLPDYLRQQPNPSIPGAANNMIRALMAGATQQPTGAPNAPPALGAAPASQWPSVNAPGAAGAGVPFTAPLMTPPPGIMLPDLPPVPVSKGTGSMFGGMPGWAPGETPVDW